MRERAARLAHRIGHRGAFLLFLAVLDAAYGYSLITIAPARLTVLHLLVPPAVWGWAWVTVGAACAACAFVRRDRAAYALAAGLFAAWAGITARAWLAYNLPQGWVSVVVWAAFAVTVLLIASWPEPPLRGPP